MHSTLLALVVVVLGITATLSAPLEQRQGSQRGGPVTREEQINYLRRFGHWRGQRSDQIDTDDDLSRSLMTFQNFYGLEATGEFDDKTKELMAAPRCGVPDHNEDSGRRKRFEISRKWPMTALTYRIENYTPDLPTTVTKNEIIKAFKFWSDVSPLTFTESNTNETNIKLAFVSRVHGKCEPFDGLGGVLAHAWPFPIGFVHFDEDETWTPGNISGKNYKNLLWVATHEIGHALGLDHSNVSSSVMFANYSSDNSYLDFTLDPDDIEGIQFLYGKPLSTILPNE